MAIMQNASPFTAIMDTKYTMSNESRASIGKHMLFVCEHMRCKVWGAHGKKQQKFCKCGVNKHTRNI